MREASLSETGIDIGFVLNLQASPRLFNLLEPLDAYMAQEPIEDFADVFDGQLESPVGIIQAGSKETPYYTNSSQLPVGFTDDPFEEQEVAVRPDGTQLWVTTEGYLQVFSIPAHAAVFTSGWTDGFGRARRRVRPRARHPRRSMGFARPARCRCRGRCLCLL